MSVNRRKLLHNEILARKVNVTVYI